MRQRTLRALRLLAWYVVGWALAALVFWLVRFVGIEDTPAFRSVDLSALDRGNALQWTVLAGALIGLGYGLLDPLFEVERLRRLAYGPLILLQAGVHVVVLVVVMLVANGLRARAEATSDDLFGNILSPNLLVVLAYTGIVSVAFAFVKHVDRKFGPGNLVKLMVGRYHRPREERRIFLFIDLQASTTLAESLGHVRYSRLIQDCFQDLAVVLEDCAEVYQYVGDEAVLCWDEDVGLRDAACLRAFFRFDEKLRSRSEWYRAQYGAVPVFKAGANLGVVTVAEVGEIKREIAFHGDVLNTASRIQSRCNELGQRMLVSQYLLDALGPLSGFRTERMGNVTLRGRAETVDIHAVELA